MLSLCIPKWTNSSPAIPSPSSLTQKELDRVERTGLMGDMISCATSVSYPFKSKPEKKFMLPIKPMLTLFAVTWAGTAWMEKGHLHFLRYTRLPHRSCMEPVEQQIIFFSWSTTVDFFFFQYVVYLIGKDFIIKGIFAW